MIKTLKDIFYYLNRLDLTDNLNYPYFLVFLKVQILKRKVKLV